jgi:hypothetical protein
VSFDETTIDLVRRFHEAGHYLTSRREHRDEDMGTVNQASEDRLASLQELVALHSVEGAAELLGMESTAVTDELRLDRAIE